MLIVQTRRPDHSQRSHDLSTHACRSADKDKVAHGGHGFIKPDNDSYRFLFCVEIRAKQLHHFFFLFQRPQHVLKTLPIILAGDKVSRAFDEYYLSTHVPIANALPGLRRNEVSKVSGSLDGSTPPYHLLAELYFDRERMRRAAGHRLAWKLVAQWWLRQADLAPVELARMAAEDLAGGVGGHLY